MLKIWNDQVWVWLVCPPVIPSWPKFHVLRPRRISIGENHLITVSPACSQRRCFLRDDTQLSEEVNKLTHFSTRKVQLLTDLGQSFLPKSCIKKPMRLLCCTGVMSSKADREMITTSLVWCSNQSATSQRASCRERSFIRVKHSGVCCDRKIIKVVCVNFNYDTKNKLEIIEKFFNETFLFIYSYLWCWL